MNKLKKLELLLGASIAIVPFGFANNTGFTENHYEIFTEEDSKNPYETVVEENLNLQMIELDSGMILEIMSLLSAVEMKEEVRSSLLEQLQSGEVLILKHSQASRYIIFKNGYGLFTENGQSLGKNFFKKSKIFPIDSRPFEEIRIRIFDPKGNTMPRKILRKVKYGAWDGSKWIIITVVPILAKCGWDILKITAKSVGNFAAANPILASGAAGLGFLWKALPNGTTSRLWGFFRGGRNKEE